MATNNPLAGLNSGQGNMGGFNPLMFMMLPYLMQMFGGGGNPWQQTGMGGLMGGSLSGQSLVPPPSPQAGAPNTSRTTAPPITGPLPAPTPLPVNTALPAPPTSPIPGGVPPAPSPLGGMTPPAPGMLGGDRAMGPQAGGSQSIDISNVSGESRPDFSGQFDRISAARGY